MEFPIMFDPVKSGWSIVYNEESQVINFKKYYNSFSEDRHIITFTLKPPSTLSFMNIHAKLHPLWIIVYINFHICT